jgi:hypothetical protein
MGLFDRLQSEMDGRDKAAGLTMADVLLLPADQRQIVNWIMRQGEASLPDIVAQTGQDELTVRRHLAALVDRGFLRELAYPAGPQYRPRLAARRRQQLPLDVWQALSDRVKE